MTATNPVKKIIIISALILLMSFGIYHTQNLINQILNERSQIDIEIHTYDPGLQQASIEDIEKIPTKQWPEKKSTTYTNLYIEQTLWDRVIIKNHSNSDKTIVVSEQGNYTTRQTIYSDLDISDVKTRFSNESFKQKLVLPANTHTTIHIKKSGYQLNNNNTKIYEYHVYRLYQLLGIISSTWAYGAILGVCLFYIGSIKSRQTQLGERLALFGFAFTTILVSATENNFHSLIELAPTSVDSIGKKIALPLILAPLSSYLLLRTYNISSNSHPLQQLSIVFFISTLLLAYCLINNYIIPIIYLSFTIIAFVHQFCWLHHACKSTQLNNIGQTASLSFLLASTFNHLLVIALAALPSLSSARLNIIYFYYLICISSAVAMLNDKNIIQFVKSQLQQKNQQRIDASNSSYRETQNISINADKLLSSTQQQLQPHLAIAAIIINKLRLLHMESNWRRQFINTQTTFALLYESYAKVSIQKKPASKQATQHYVNFSSMLKLLKERHETQALQPTQPATTLELTTGLTPGIIIIIDDNRIAAAATAKTIQHLGYQLEIFTNPLQALQYIAIKTSLIDSNDKIVAIIADYEMPEISGLQTLQEAKNIYTNIYTNINSNPPTLIIFSSISRQIKSTPGIHIINKTKQKHLLAALNHA